MCLRCFERNEEKYNPVLRLEVGVAFSEMLDSMWGLKFGETEYYSEGFTEIETEMDKVFTAYVQRIYTNRNFSVGVIYSVKDECDVAIVLCSFGGGPRKWITYIITQ